LSRQVEVAVAIHVAPGHAVTAVHVVRKPAGQDVQGEGVVGTNERQAGTKQAHHDHHPE
jgi:hypothetical protein